MEVGGFFLLLIVAIVLLALGGGLYALVLWLRGKKLAPEGDQLEDQDHEEPRPEHLEVSNEQRTRFIGSG